MLIGTSAHGDDDGVAGKKYLLAAKDKNGKIRSVLPVVVRGDPDVVLRLIRSSPNVWKYTSGVLSWAPGEEVPPDREIEIMDGFERAAFAGLEHDQYSIFWVRHQHAGHHELHYMTPRLELRTRKSLNVAPPGKTSRDLFDAFRSWVNARYGYADPDDPSRARTTRLPSFIHKITAANPDLKKGEREDLREKIDQYLGKMVAEGLVINREDVVLALKDAGLQINRAGKDYLSVRLGESKPIRLKGTLYDESFRADVEGARAHERRARQFEGDAAGRAERSFKKLCQLTEARAQFNRKRYRTPASKVPDRNRNARAADVEVAVGSRHERLPPVSAGDRIGIDVVSGAGAMGAVATPSATGGSHHGGEGRPGESVGAGGGQPVLLGKEWPTVHESLKTKGEINGRLGYQADRTNSSDTGAREEGRGSRIAAIARLNRAIGKHHEDASKSFRKLAEADRRFGKIVAAVSGAVKQVLAALKKRFKGGLAPAERPQTPRAK
jgi:hypothetical protein